MMPTKEEITEWFKSLQDSICTALRSRRWERVFLLRIIGLREEGGGGRTRIIQNGNVIEKGGVNFSAVHGDVPSFCKTTMVLRIKETYLLCYRCFNCNSSHQSDGAHNSYECSLF
jgi:coproporphyrinogen III oxidase